NRLERRDRPAWRFLRDIADPRAAGHLDRAFVGFQLTDQDSHQRRLAGAIAADQADTAPRRNRCRGFVEDRTPAKADGDVAYRDHGGAPLAAESGKPNAGWTRQRCSGGTFAFADDLLGQLPVAHPVDV